MTQRTSRNFTVNMLGILMALTLSFIPSVTSAAGGLSSGKLMTAITDVYNRKITVRINKDELTLIRNGKNKPKKEFTLENNRISDPDTQQAVEWIKQNTSTLIRFGDEKKVNELISKIIEKSDNKMSMETFKKTIDGMNALSSNGEKLDVTSANDTVTIENTVDGTEKSTFPITAFLSQSIVTNEQVAQFAEAMTDEDANLYLEILETEDSDFKAAVSDAIKEGNDENNNNNEGNDENNNNNEGNDESTDGTDGDDASDEGEDGTDGSE